MKLFSWTLRIGIFLLALAFGTTAAVVARGWLHKERVLIQLPETLNATGARPVVATPSIPNVSVSDPQTDKTTDTQDSRAKYDISYLTGDYYPELEPLPASFSGFDHFSIETAVFNDTGEATIVPPSGSLRVARVTYKIRRLAIAQSEMAFQTSTIHGISYKFTGHIENFPTSADSGVPYLFGKLIKIQNGKWMGEMEATFFIEDGC